MRATDAARRRYLRLKDFDHADENQVFFVTIAARRDRASKARPKHFVDRDLASEVIHAIHDLRRKKDVTVYCYCLMPDHLHLLLSPSKKSGSLVGVMREFKSYTTRVAWSHGWEGRFWARSYYERVMRSERAFRETCRYVLDNPVRAGLVTQGEEYEFLGLVDPLPL